jgi:type II secretory pathway pseudopilin PulG
MIKNLIRLAEKILNLKFRTGFTLIEMLIYVVILVLVIASLVIFGIGIIRTGAKIKANSEVLDNSRRAIEIISFEIRKSKSIYAPTSVFDSNPGQLSLEQTNSPSAEEKSIFVDFFKCGDSLCLKREGSSPFAITSSHVKVTNLVFSELFNSVSRPSVQITLRLETAAGSIVPGYSSSIEVTTTINLKGR